MIPDIAPSEFIKENKFTFVSGDFIKKDGTTRMTEEQAKEGSIGLLQGAEVVSKSLELIKFQK